MNLRSYLNLSLLAGASFAIFATGPSTRAAEPPITVDILLNHPMRLETGAMKSISLSGGVFLSKLFVQAQGIGRDASFEVVVNGDTKGTVHVPGRDPSYVVTIEDYANSVQFRHIEGGPVEISSVEAVEFAGNGNPVFPLHSRGVNQASAIARNALRQSGTWLGPVPA